MAMDLKLEIDDRFSLGAPQSFSCPSTSSSFSSASSSYDPFTPTSGRSSPTRRPSVDFESSFYSDPAGFDMTPPSSAVSSYFPIHHHMKNDMEPDFLPNGMPVTPSRYGSNMLDATLASHSWHGPLTPTHSMDMYSFAESMGSSPFMVPTPAHSIYNGNSCDVPTLWSMGMDSPVTFENHPSPLKSMRDDGSPFAFNRPRRRLFMEDAQQKSNVLQRVQQAAHMPLRSSGKRDRTGAVVSSGHNGVSVQRIAAGAFKCDVPGCSSKPFKRMEHLKRHIDTTHKNKKNFPCKYCSHKFNRQDNWRQHLKLHTEKRGRNSRTTYHPDALQDLEDEQKRIKQRRPTNKEKDDDEICSEL
ncbi:uncharacterized protein E0L32_009689 [Thyridium curvatum]|uniref:C2H2-type domain-containing protein n=1 Tax=Thyridium curvatum TaxID=1093900 RepID=A0A507AVC2_9PEZI|nr:uncharacterized protein E0L32_009689 [Thyridium curvatum]TPX08871.1 hypothetical protein E0L32_009689 [Thyridium curvatum]